MKRFLKALATFSLVELIGRHPVIAGTILLLGVGGAGVTIITTPTITPQSAVYFNQNQSFGTTNNGLKPNAGSNGSMQPPTSDPTGSFAVAFEMTVDSALGYGQAVEGPFGGMLATTNTVPGQPSFWYTRLFAGQQNTPWWISSGPSSANTGGSASAGSNYNTGFYPFTATGGGCAREPSGVWLGGSSSMQITDIGFGCTSTPTISVASIATDGARQNAGLNASLPAATCATGPTSGEVTITIQTPLAHGVSPGMLYALGGLASPFATNYTALPGTTGTTLVGEASINSGTCSGFTDNSAATALSGTGATITMPAVSSTSFGGGPTGIMTKNGQHICAIIGEYGDDSPFPGGQFVHMVDDKGNALIGAPALVPLLNQGVAAATGYVTHGTTAVVITSLTPFTISSASYNATTGYVTFLTSTSTGLVPGSEFTVSGMTSSSGNVNITYVAVTGTTGSTVVGNPLSGPEGTPQAITNPGTISTGVTPQMTSVIMPGMQILGVSSSSNNLMLAPTSTFIGTGTYNLNGNPTTSTTFTVSAVNTGTPSITVTGTPAPELVVGSTFTLNANTYVITNIGSATGGAGTYTVNTGASLATGTATLTGDVGSSGTPVNLFFFPGAYYQSVAASTNPVGGTVTARTASQFADFIASFGAASIQAPSGSLKTGWGGTLGNIAMLYGVFPQTTGGAPSTTALASLCKKTTDIQSFATANSLKVNALYHLNDIGIFGDSSDATITGYIDTASGTSGGTATLHVLSTVYGSLALPTGTQTAKLTAVGLPLTNSSGTVAPATIPLTTSSSSSYTVTFPSGVTSFNLASSGSPITFSVGAFLPMTPLQSGTFTGYIDEPSSVPTLHVTALPTSPSGAAANFTGSLGTGFTGSISGNTLTITTPFPTGTSNAVAAPGMTVVIPGGTNAHITVQLTSTASNGVPGQAGTYTIDGSPQTIASESMFGTNPSGSLPGPATTLYNVTGVTGTIATGMYITDGGASITGSPLLITGGSGTVWNVAGNYYPPIVADATMVGSLSAIVPGSYVQTSGAVNPGITNPVKVIGYGTGNGGLGTYILSGQPNASGLVGSSGSPVTLTGTSAQDGGAIAPGPALTIRDQGPGVVFPVTESTISCSALGSCTGNGTLFLSGTYDTSALGGTPSTIQAQISLSAGGPPVPGCSACTWANLASYTAALSSGTVFNWSGQDLNIPAGGPYYVSVRAANGTAYATLPNLVKVGVPVEIYGQGQFQACPSNQSGQSLSYFTGLWGTTSRHSFFPANYNPWFSGGPPIANNFLAGDSETFAGDRFGATGSIPLSECVGDFEQLITNAFGWPASVVDMTHDGVGNAIMTLDQTTQTQTVGVGDGTDLTWCSASKFCTDPSGGIQQPLVFSAAALTGARFTGTIAGSQLTVGSTMTNGALMPGMLLTYSGSSGTTTITNCTSNCGSATAIAGGSSVWTLSNSPGNVTSLAMSADYPQTGGTPWPGYNFQLTGSLPFNLLGYGTPLVKVGTFSISVNGTVVCTDSSTFAYNQTGGNCTGANIASSFVNYQTGDYEITFSSGHAPANNAAIVASWTNIISPIVPPSSTQFGRMPGLGYFGDGSGPESGSIESLMNKTPGGLAGHVNSGCSTDTKYVLASGSPANVGYQYGAVGYSEAASWFYDTKFTTLPGFNSTTPYIAFGQWRDEGPSLFQGGGSDGDICDSWFIDSSAKSTFTGHISGTTLTLDSNAVGPMWEGEVIGSGSFVSPSGVYITSLASGAWGASGSTYVISNAGSISASANTAMYNDVYYKGSGPVIYGGPLDDIIVQNQGLSGTTGSNPHMWLGQTGGGRVGRRLAATIWEGFNGTSVATPTVDRVKADATGCDAAALAAPCLDIGNTYDTVATPTGVSGAVLTFNGLSAHTRPIVDGQAVSCSGCTTGLYVVSVSNPPTQSTVGGQGQIGTANNGFTVTLNTAPGASAVPFTFGCKGTSGTGSNCIDVAITVNAPGTYGTAAAIATCGANNLNGNAPNYFPPTGVCNDNGIGELVRGFRIGTTQAMYISPFPTGSVFDDGVDFVGGAFSQSAAFTCNIVAAKVVQCVKAPAYTSGAPSGVGQWATGSTFINYGEMTIQTGRIASVLGYVGGQSFPISSAGSGYANGTYTAVIASCPTVASGDTLPRFDVTVSGGVIVNVYPSATSTSLSTQAPGLGIGSACTLTDTNFPTGMKNGGAGSGGSINIPLAPVEGVGGVATFNTDQNDTGQLIYDNSGFSGNPLNMFFTNGQGAYFEPGLPLRPFGESQGLVVSG